MGQKKEVLWLDIFPFLGYFVSGIDELVKKACHVDMKKSNWSLFPAISNLGPKIKNVLKKCPMRLIKEEILTLPAICKYFSRFFCYHEKDLVSYNIIQRFLPIFFTL